MIPKVDGTAIWLLPEISLCKSLSRIINTLAVRYKSPEFKPHITLCSLPENAGTDPVQLARNLADQRESFEIETGNVVCRSDYYRKLVIELVPNPSFYEYCNQADHLAPKPISKTHDPHLSLLYSNVSCTNLSNEISELKHQIPAFIPIHGISVVQLNGGPDSWKIISTYTLSNKPEE
jgi:hypothetical protein